MAFTSDDFHEAIRKREDEERQQAIRNFLEAMFVICLLAVVALTVIAVCAAAIYFNSFDV